MRGITALFSGSTATETVLVKNVEPTIDAVAVSAPKDNKAMPGDDVTLSATFTDQGLLDRHDVVVGWDDGTADSVFDVDATADLAAGDSFTSRKRVPPEAITSSVARLPSYVRTVRPVAASSAVKGASSPSVA